MTQTTNRKQQKHKCPRILQLFWAVLCDMAKDDAAVWWSNFVSQGRQSSVLWLSPTLISPISYSWLKPFFFWSPSRRSCLGKATKICKVIFLEAQVQECHAFLSSQEGERFRQTDYTVHAVLYSVLAEDSSQREEMPTPWEGGTRLRTRMEIKWLRVSHFIPMSTVLLHNHASSNVANGPLLAPCAGKDPSPGFLQSCWLSEGSMAPLQLFLPPLCFLSSHFKCKISLRDSHRKGTLIYLLLILWNCNRNWFGILYPILMKLDFFKKYYPD